MRRWLSRLSAVTWAVVVLVGVAIVAVVVAVASDRLDNWAPNIATEALSIAVTVGVVERIVRRENRRLVQPRVDRATQVLAHAIRMFAIACLTDLARSHPDSDIDELPNDPLELLVHWQDNWKIAANSPRGLLMSAKEFVEKVRMIAEADRDLLPADVVVAADNVNQPFGALGSTFDEDLEAVTGRPEGDNRLERAVVESARALGDALRRHGAI